MLVAPIESPAPRGSTPAPARRRIGEVLVAAGLIAAEQLAIALTYQRAHGGRLGAALITLGYLSEEQLTSGLASQLGLAVADLETLDPADELVNLLPETFLRDRRVVPLAIQNRALVLGMVDPTDQRTLDDVARLTGHRNLEPRLVTAGSFNRFLGSRFTAPAVVNELVTALGTGASALLDRNGALDLGPLVSFVDWLLRYAVRMGASDIHIEPFERFVRVRLRVDGALQTILTPSAAFAQPLVSRVKVMAQMDISERRKPQDGHIELALPGGEPLHFRISTLPVVHGEKCVVRLLRKEAQLADLARLGFGPTQLATIKGVASMPQGLLLVTGPTGSGKTTTLHAVLNHINDPDINIVTIEDPVEQTIAGINHVQVQERGGVTFASALRSILRQDPDVVFVGEMRDPEVSAIAVKAALTGHLVLSTLHTNGTAETFARLTDMGIPSYLVASSVQLVVAQRLVRRLCACALPTAIEPATATRFGLGEAQLATALLRRPVGCPRCLGQGYKGRVAVYELVAPSPELREVLRRGGDESAILAVLNREGMTWLWNAGIARALAGETTLEEVARTISPPKS